MFGLYPEEYLPDSDAALPATRMTGPPAVEVLNHGMS
jgi:hypothetical protein